MHFLALLVATHNSMDRVTSMLVSRFIMDLRDVRPTAPSLDPTFPKWSTQTAGSSEMSSFVLELGQDLSHTLSFTDEEDASCEVPF